MRLQEQDGLPEALLSTLLSSTPWNEQVQSLSHLTELAISPSPTTLRQLRALTPYFQSAINNPRSTLVRSVCATISTLAETLKAPFVEAVGNAIIPDLVARSSVTKAVIRDSCVTAARSLFEHGVEGVHFATVKTLAETVTDRRSAASIRATAALFLGLILVDNCRPGVQYIINVVSAAIIAGCADPDETVRAHSRENCRRLQALDPAVSAEVFRNLAPQTVQLINRERDYYGDPFRTDRGPARATAVPDAPARQVVRSGFRPARVVVEEQPTERKPRPLFRPPRRSILPSAFVNLPPSTPDDSPPKRSEMNPARRVFSPMAVDPPVPVDTPASVSTPASLNMSVSMSTSATVASPPLAGTPSFLNTPVLERLTTVDQRRSGSNLKVSPRDDHAVTSSVHEISEKSVVSSLSSSSGSRRDVTETSNVVMESASHVSKSSLSSVADTEKSMSAVSSSSTNSAISPQQHAIQKIAGSGAPRGTNEDSSSKTPPQSLQHQTSGTSSKESPPETKKGRLSFILGANQTPRVFTPLPSVATMAGPEEPIEPFTPMDICTPMKTEEGDGPLSGVVMKPLARSLGARLDEVAQEDHSEGNAKQINFVPSPKREQPKAYEAGEETPKGQCSPKQKNPLNNDAGSSAGKEGIDASKSPHYLQKKDLENLSQESPENHFEVSEEIVDTPIAVADAKGASDQELPKTPEVPSTPDSLEDELLKEVASLTSSLKKGQASESEDEQSGPSWDILVHDLEKTLGISAPVIDDPCVPERKPDIEPTTDKREEPAKVETVPPGIGKENQLPPVNPQKQSKMLKTPPEITASDEVEDKDKSKTEMTKAERQAALARRPPRRSIHPGAIKPMPQEKRSVRPSLPATLQPATERRKPPVPTFTRKPSVTGKSIASNAETKTQPLSQETKEPVATQAPVATARKAPATTRKLPLYRSRVSSAAITSNSAIPSASTNRSTALSQQRSESPPGGETRNEAIVTQASTTSKPVSALPPRTAKAARKQTPRQIAVIDAYRACARAKKAVWSAKLEALKTLESTIQGLQGDSLPPRLCDDATGLLGEYAQEAQYKVQLAALDALFYLLLCTERAPQITALQRAFEKRPEILRRILAILKDGREDVRLACGRVMQSFEALFGPEIQVSLLMKAVSGVEGKIVEMGCTQMLKAFERARHGDGFVWKAGMLESLVSLLATLKQNRRVEVRQSASKALDAVKECLPERAFEIVCRKVGVRV